MRYGVIWTASKGGAIIELDRLLTQLEGQDAAADVGGDANDGDDQQWMGETDVAK